jgi:hypothetical protein
MKTISLKIDTLIFGETEMILSHLKIPRNRYINEALAHYNELKHRQLIEKQLLKDSTLVKEESMRVLTEFERIDYVD